MKKKLLILCLAFCLICQNLPISVLAAPTETAEKECVTDESTPPSSEPETDSSTAAESEPETDSSTAASSEPESGESIPTSSESESDADESPDETSPEDEAESETQTETPPANSVSGNDVSANSISANGLTPAAELFGEVDDSFIIQSGSLKPPAQKSANRVRSSSAIPAEAYDYVIEQLKARSSSIDVSRFNIPVSSIRNFHQALINEHPELYFVENSIRYSYLGDIIYSLYFTYLDDCDDAAFAAAVTEALSLLDDSLTDYEKALILHECLTLNCEYDYDNYLNGSIPRHSYTAYGPLVNRTAVCQGYALAYKYLLKQAGIDAYMVTSDAMNHAWNLLYIDGEYYQADVTWDDPVRDQLGKSRHSHFLVSDARLTELNHHDWVVRKDADTVNFTADSTRFENEYWKDVTSGILYNGGSWFYINNSSIVKRNGTAGPISSIYQINERWTVWDNPYSYYTNAYSGLAFLNSRLYFNSPRSINSISPSGDDLRTEYVPNTSNGFIYGMALQDGAFSYLLAQAPGEGGDIYRVDLSNPIPVPVTSIVLNRNEMTLKAGDTTKLEVSVYPNHASDRTVSWSSSDPAIASVREGTVTALAEGSCIITAKNEASGKFAVCSVTVNGPVPAPAADPPSGCLDRGEAVSLTCTLTDVVIYYTKDGSEPSENSLRYTAPVIINDSCTLKAFAVKEGHDSSPVSVFFYTVYDSKLLLSDASLTLTECDTHTLEAIKIPETRTASDLIWTSSDPGVAEIEQNGTIMAVAPGTADITASVSDYRNRTVSAVCSVAINPLYFTVTFKGPDGTVIDTQQVARKNAAQAPNPPVIEGYEFQEWSLPFLEITCDLIVEAIYEPVTYSISYLLNGGTFQEEPPRSYTVESAPVSIPVPVRENYVFTGWFLDEDLTKAIHTIEKGSTGNLTLFAAWRPVEEQTGLHMEDIPDCIYSGSAIKPQITVYDGQRLLTPNIDYSVSYANNKGVNLLTTEKEKNKAPAVIIKGKGGYSGTVKKTFRILPLSISDSTITAEDLWFRYNGKARAFPPALYHNKKKLSANTDYVLEYPSPAPGAPLQPGQYEVKVTGKGNYTGERMISLTILEPEKGLLSKATVKKIPAQPYPAGGEAKPELTVKYGKLTLIQNKDYTVSWENNTGPGTAYAIIKGCGNYGGQKKVPFTITAVSISKAVVTGLNSKVPYTGEEIIQNCSLHLKGSEMPLSDDCYTVSYQNNRRAGKATIIFTGINGYTGTLKKTFTILPYDIAQDKEQLLITESGITALYQKGGSRPRPSITFGNTLLLEGTDYTLSYKNNTAVSDGGSPRKLPTIIIRGKGNFKGSVSVPFSITAQNIADILSISAPDLIYKNKKNAWQSTPLLIDTNGKKLTAGTDYEKTLTYTNASGVPLVKNDIPPIGAKITVTVTGKGNYTGSHSTSYRILDKNKSLSSASVKMTQPQYYTGYKLYPGKDVLIVKIGNTVLSSDDYEITDYSGNLAVGYAAITLRGRESAGYGGVKTIRFKILPQVMKWQE